MNYELMIGWLYPDLMSTYGDRGNIICLTKRCFWRNIGFEILRIGLTTSEKGLTSCDLIFGGGAQDRQQAIAVKDLLRKKNSLQQMFDNNIPGLFVCGAPQLLGHYYETADRTKLPGLGIFDMHTESGFGKPRLIGNLIAKINKDSWGDRGTLGKEETIVGFENHSGRTFLGKGVNALAKVVKGFGNNGEDRTEGAVYKNCLATYSHGPFLPKNPHLADWLIKTALEVKYQKRIELKPLDDNLEWQAHNFILKMYG